MTIRSPRLPPVLAGASLWAFGFNAAPVDAATPGGPLGTTAAGSGFGDRQLDHHHNSYVDKLELTHC